MALTASVQRAVGDRSWVRTAGVALGVSVAGFAILLGVALALSPLVLDVVGGRHLGGWDLDVSRSLADARSDPLDAVTFIGSTAAGQYLVPVLVVIATAILVWVRRWRWAGLVVIGFTLEGLLYLATTGIISRGRPPVGQLESLVHDDSYYSGHVAASVVMVGIAVLVVADVTISSRVRASSWVLAAAFVGWIGFSRVERGMHYTTDAFVGALVGFGCVVTAWLAVRTATRVAAAHRGS